SSRLQCSAVVVFCGYAGGRLALPSFPTRRSSDLGVGSPDERLAVGKPARGTVYPNAYHQGTQVVIEVRDGRRSDKRSHGQASQRSEEHTSELQSQSNLVCRLLLEKKNRENARLLH